jgi:uncharacterized membrane protein
MNEQETPQEAGSPESSASPPEDPSPTPEQGGPASQNRSLMIVLSYLWILFLIPMLIEKDDAEVQWHAKHGLVLTVVEFLIQVGLYALAIGCFFIAFFSPLVFFGFAVLRVIAIVKGINGERFSVPGLTQYVEKF